MVSSQRYPIDGPSCSYWFFYISIYIFWYNVNYSKQIPSLDLLVWVALNQLVTHLILTPDEEDVIKINYSHIFLLLNYISLQLNFLTDLQMTWNQVGSFDKTNYNWFKNPNMGILGFKFLDGLWLAIYNL